MMVDLSSNVNTSMTVTAPKQYLNVSGLYKYWLYCVQVLGFNVMGKGVISPCLNVSTKQDIPSAPPKSVVLNATSSRTILITWKPVPAEYQHGVITHYRVRSRYCEGNIRQPYVDVSQNNVTLYYELNGNPNACYEISMCGKTVQGRGNCTDWQTISTPEDSPTGSPTNITSNPISSTSTNVTWGDVIQTDQNGLILGYRVKLSEENHTVYIVNTTAKSYIFDNLKKFTEYCVQVLAYTKIGDGPWSNCSNQRTGQDVPDQPPLSLVGQNISTESLKLSWLPPPESSLNGVLLGYNVYAYLYYYDGSLSSTPYSIASTCANSTSIVLEELHKGMQFCMVVASFTSAGEGRRSNCTNQSTNEDVPSAPPRDIASKATSPTSLRVSWRDVEWTNRNGIIRGYTLVLSRVAITTPTTAPNTPTQLATSQVISTIPTTTNTTSPPQTTVIRISPRRKRRSYHNVDDDRDLNNMEKGFHKEPVEQDDMIVQEKARHIRHRRSTPTDIVIQLRPEVTSHEVTGLEKGAKYCITLRANTSAGNGVTSNCVNQMTPITDNIVPRVSLQASAMSIIVTLHISDFDNLRDSGYLQYYDLEFNVISKNGKPVFDGDQIQRKVKATTMRFAIDGFDIYTLYVFQATLVTNSGRSSPTSPVYIETCRCPSTFYTNWCSIPPFSKLQTNSKPSGVFPPIIKEVVSIACGRCELTNTLSTVDFFFGIDGKKDSYKINQTSIKTSITSTTDISFPFNSMSTEAKYKGIYIPVLHVPGLLLVKRNESAIDKYGQVVAGSIIDIWPIIVINIVLLLAAGTIIWTIERMSNSSQFPVQTHKGFFEGAWWSFITMTTIGYGDRYPVTVVGRIFAIIWALVGISMSSILVGTICSSLTITIVQEISSGVPRGIKVGAIKDMPDFQIASDVSAAAGADIFSYSNIEELVFALRSKQIDSIVLDHFTVLDRKDLFNGTWYKFSDVVGQSFSYGLILNGNASNLDRQFREYISANITKIMALVGGVDEIVVSGDNKTEPEEPKRIVIQTDSINFLNPGSEFFKTSMMAMGLCLLAVALLGLAYHVMVYRKQDRSIEILTKEYKERVQVLKSELQQFHDNVSSMLKRKKKQFKMEQRLLAEQKANNTSPSQAPVSSIRPLSVRQYQRKLSLHASEIEF